MIKRMVFFAASIAVAGTAKATIKDLAFGINHSCAVFDDGRVKCWGGNAGGQLGLEDTKSRGRVSSELGSALPYVNLGARKAVQLSAGSSYTCARFDDGKVTCWGHNTDGVLGYEEANNRGDKAGDMGDKLPIVDLGKDYKAIDLQSRLTNNCVLLSDYSVKCWGSNRKGQLGQGDVVARGTPATTMGDGLKPIALGTGRTAKKIGVGANHACALLDDATVKCWGAGIYGAIGSEGTDDLGAKANQMGDKLLPLKLGTGRSAKDLLVGGFHTCVLLDNQQWTCFGRNSTGALGLGHSNNIGNAAGQMGDALKPFNLNGDLPVRSVAIGGFHTCMVFEMNTAKCVGSNNFGQLAVGDSMTRGSTIDTIGNGAPYIDLGSLVAVKKIWSGDFVGCAMIQENKIKCWGSNIAGQLGVGKPNPTIGASKDTTADKMPYLNIE